MAATMLLPAAAHASTPSSSAKTAAVVSTKTVSTKTAATAAAKTATTSGFKDFAGRPTVTRVVTAHPKLNVRTSGGPVRWVQRRLGVKATGRYDAATIATVRRLQAAHGLKATGVVDRLTWSVMGVRYVKSAAKLSVNAGAVNAGAVTGRAPGGAVFGDLVMRLAAKHQGTRYRYGGRTPGGFDCSGFVGYVYRQIGISLPRTSGAINRSVKRISKSQVRRGDLVFVRRGGGRVTHVGIYAGKGLWYESSRPGIRVGLHRAWTSKNVSYGRIAS